MSNQKETIRVVVQGSFASGKGRLAAEVAVGLQQDGFEVVWRDREIISPQHLMLEGGNEAYQQALQGMKEKLRVEVSSEPIGINERMAQFIQDTIGPKADEIVGVWLDMSPMSRRERATETDYYKDLLNYIPAPLGG